MQVYKGPLALEEVTGRVKRGRLSTAYVSDPFAAGRRQSQRGRWGLSRRPGTGGGGH